MQDRWQIDRLTLNLGLRWDYQTLTPNTKAALGPRVGVAWDPMGTARTVIRGGFGKNYETENLILRTGLIEGDVAANSFIFQTDQDESGLAGRIPANPCLQPSMGAPGIAVIGPTCRAQLTQIGNAVLADQFVNTEPLLDNPDRVMPYVWSFSVGVKHELMTDLAVSADYIGNRGRDITAVVDINEPRVLPNGTRGRPGVNVFDPDGTLIPAQFRGAAFQRVLQFQNLDAFNTDHNALELGLEKRYRTAGADGSPIRCRNPTTCRAETQRGSILASSDSPTTSTRAATTAARSSTTAMRSVRACTSRRGAGSGSAPCTAFTRGSPSTSWWART